MKPFTDQDPETKSPDLVAENIEQLKALFPEAFTEGMVDFEVLKQLLGGTVDEREEKYGLNWHGKRRARQLALTPSTGTLRPCPQDSVDWDTTQNLMIEGDNLEVLKLLQKSYAGKVKLIYIDPPYNTGKDFVYPDNFQDNIKNYLELTGQVEGGRKISSNTEASGRFHTDWLNMMYPRLKLARNLLREDGAIFISIDDQEVRSLRTICDEIFGEENFVVPIIWQKRITTEIENCDIVLDFFAGSGTTGHAVLARNSSTGSNSRFILVQLPVPLDPENKEQKIAADYCDRLNKPRTITELTKERLRRAGKKIREENPLFKGDLGFRVFKMASSNIQVWEPNRENLAQTLEDSVEHLKTDRTEQDILFELLLKLGLDLTVPMEEKTIAGKTVHSIGAGTLLVCLAPQITVAEVESLALGIVEWHKQLAPASECSVVFRDSAFTNDVAKTNLAAILHQHGLENVRSL
jgi:DNA modification methylase